MLSWFSRAPTGSLQEQRAQMVEEQIRRRGLSNETVLSALRAVPRHLFVPERHRHDAYGDHALPIGLGQTISQPYIVALMTAAAEPGPGVRVLEVGTGSGYQAAVLAASGCEVYTIERIEQLFEGAREAIREAGYAHRIRQRLGDGSKGWPEEAPFDRILLTAAAAEVPVDLVDQLDPDGFIVAPIGTPELQTIYRIRKDADGLDYEPLEGARFVPLIAGDDRER
jgi:protein-L-isoaspartate(D-aspartate) O-methyltransferase